MRLTAFRSVAVRGLLLAILFVGCWAPAPFWRAGLHDPGYALRLSQVLHAGLWLVGASLLVALINLALWDRILPRHRGAPAPHLLRDTLRIAIYLAAIGAVATFVFNQPVAGFWTASGAVGVVLALALRSIILDLFTGVAFSVELSFRVGDWLEVSDRQAAGTFYGRVVGMTWRTTRLELEDERILIVPNSRMGQLILVNYSQHGGVVRSEALISLSAATPADRVLRVLQAAALAAAQDGKIEAEPAPCALIGAVTAQGVEYRVRYWQNVNAISLIAARGVVFASLLRHLAAAGIAPATPQQDVRLVDAQEHFGVEDRTKRRMNFLGHIDLLDDTLREAELEMLARSVRQRSLKRGEILIEQGDEGGSLFLLSEGLLEVLKTTATGLERVAIVEPGQVVGEMSLLTGEPRSATVRAMAECVVQEVGADPLRTLMLERPAIAEGLSRVAARRFADSTRAPQTAEEHKAEGVAALILHRIQRFFGLGGA